MGVTRREVLHAGMGGAAALALGGAGVLGGVAQAANISSTAVALHTPPMVNWFVPTTEQAISTKNQFLASLNSGNPVYSNEHWKISHELNLPVRDFLNKESLPRLLLNHRTLESKELPLVPEHYNEAWLLRERGGKIINRKGGATMPVVEIACNPSYDHDQVKGASPEEMASICLITQQRAAESLANQENLEFVYLLNRVVGFDKTYPYAVTGVTKNTLTSGMINRAADTLPGQSNLCLLMHPNLYYGYGINEWPEGWLRTKHAKATIRLEATIPKCFIYLCEEGLDLGVFSLRTPVVSLPCVGKWRREDQSITTQHPGWMVFEDVAMGLNVDAPVARIMVDMVPNDVVHGKHQHLLASWSKEYLDAYRKALPDAHRWWPSDPYPWVDQTKL